MNKLVYRYDDINVADMNGGATATIALTKRVVVKETACYLWSIYAGMNPEYYEITDYDRACANKPHYKGQVIKTRKGAVISRYSETPVKALAAWRTRKHYQLKRLELALERVRLCVDQYDAGAPWNVCPQTIYCGTGPVMSQYDWREI